MKLLLRLSTLATIIALSFTGSSASAAVTGFDAGHIIDDGVFTNTSTMSASDIQNFLNSKVPNCDTNHAGFTGGTGTVYSAPWICLKDFYENPGATYDIAFSYLDKNCVAQSGSRTYYYNNAYKYTGLTPVYTNGDCHQGYALKATIQPVGGTVPSGAISAAQIIYNTAQQYQINPQVLIVLLQKEQSLVTDTWPASWQYQSATGYGCPDYAACSSGYSGFSNQLKWSATMFRSIMNASPTWYTPYLLGNNYIQYNPNTACGGSTVNITNRSTQSLYNYTPYQPNQAALNAGWGTGDSCSAYGNRNFYLYFTSWFGSTLSPDYSWQPVSQYAYTDETKTVAVNLSQLTPKQRVYIGFKAKNTGNMTWVNSSPNPVRVGTARPFDRVSVFTDPTWIGPGRPGTMKEASVAPGETATFEFWITAPELYASTTFNEYFTIMSEGKTWMPDIGLYYGMTVAPARYTWKLLTQYAYEDATKTKLVGLNNLYPGEKRYVGVQIQNTGNVTWVNSGNNPARLGITHPTERWSAFMGEGWLGPSRPATMKEASVAPGETATFEFWMQAPSNHPGVSLEYFSPLIEGKLWMQDIGLNFATSVVTPAYSWALTAQYAYTDDTKTTPIGLNALAKGQRVYVGFKARNTGNVPWFNAEGSFPVDVGTTSPTDRSSAYCTTGWLGCNRPTRLKEAVVYPGQEGTFEFWIQAPTTSGNYLEYFSLVAEQAAWMNNLNFNYAISVH